MFGLKEAWYEENNIISCLGQFYSQLCHAAARICANHFSSWTYASARNNGHGYARFYTCVSLGHDDPSE